VVGVLLRGQTTNAWLWCLIPAGEGELACSRKGGIGVMVVVLSSAEVRLHFGLRLDAIITVDL